MALLTNGKAHPVAATVGTLGGIVAMPFTVTGTVVCGAAGMLAAAIPTLGLGAIPVAVNTVAAVAGNAVCAPVGIGSKIYNALVPEEDAYKAPDTVEFMTNPWYANTALPLVLGEAMCGRL